MKILFLLQRLQLRGAEVFACQLALELLAKGISVDFVYLFEGDTELQKQFPALNFTSLGANASKRFWDLKAYRRLSRLIRTRGYNLVQANAGDTLKYAALSKTIFRWHSVLVFRNASKMSAYIRNYFHLQLNRWFLRNCDYFISVSENCRQDLIQIYRAASVASTTVTIGTYRFDDVAPVSKATGEPVFVNIASHVPEKNHSFVIQIFKDYFQRHQKGYLWLVGDGKLRHPLERQVENLGLKDRVVFWGYRKDVISVLKSGNVLLMPSLIEGLPGVILESLSCGIPVVVSNVGGIPEVIKDGMTGCCVSTFDSGLYVSRLEKILSEPHFKNKIIMAGKKLIDQHFMMGKIANDFLTVYRRLI